MVILGIVYYCLKPHITQFAKWKIILSLREKIPTANAV
jgi:hypothetical protein